MSTTTLLIIVLLVVLFAGGGIYGRGRWYWPQLHAVGVVSLDTRSWRATNSANVMIKMAGQ
jgi:hypothetical protein